MKKFTKRSTMVLAGVMAGLLTATASFADVTAYTAVRDGVAAQIVALGVPADNLGMLSIAQLTELTSILNGASTDEAKSMAAEFYIDEALHPSMIDINSADGITLVNDLKNKFQAIDEPYPTQPLNATQVQSLLNAFTNHRKVASQKQAVEAVLASINRSAPNDTANAGVMQMEAEIYAKLKALGIDPPPEGTLTFEQMGKLEGIFSRVGNDSVMKSSAMLVLSGQ